MMRRLSSPNLSRIAHLADRVTLLEGDLTDPSSLAAALQTARPNEVYNLAAESIVATSWNQSTLTGDAIERNHQGQFCRDDLQEPGGGYSVLLPRLV